MENAIIGAVGVLLGVTITGAINIATKWIEVRSSRKSENRKMRIERLEELHGLLWKMADARTKYARLVASMKDRTASEQISFPGNMENSARAQTLIHLYLDEALDDSICVGEAALELQVLENRRESGQSVACDVQAATQHYIDAHGKLTWKLNQRLQSEIQDSSVAKGVRGLLSRNADG